MDERPGYTLLNDGRWVADRAVWLPSLSIRRLNTILNSDKKRAEDIEKLKDYLWVIRFDHSTAKTKGFIKSAIDTNGETVFVLTNNTLLSRIKNRICELGGDPDDLMNNPLVIEHAWLTFCFDLVTLIHKVD